MRKHLLVPAVLLAAAITAAGAAADGLNAHKATSTGGTIHVFATPDQSGPGSSVVITGAIGDFGRSTHVNRAGKLVANGDFTRVTLRSGTITLDMSKVERAIDQAHDHFDATTCSDSASGAASAPITSATGAYAGLRGSVHWSFQWALIGNRFASGPKKGQCDAGPNSQPLKAWVGLQGTGSVTFA